MGRRSHRVYFKSDDISLTTGAEAFLALALLPAMRRGYAISAGGRVSRQFLDALESIMGILRTWDPSLHKVEIRSVVPVAKERPTEGRIGAFFSGGVDSFYTLLKHRDEITDLIYVHGFDVRLDDLPHRSRASQIVREVGSHLGKNVIEIETNLRSFLRPYVSYAKLAHGAALAGVGHLLAPFFRRLYIASTHTYEDQFPWGSHPQLDPLWSTETLQFVHDGCEATRIDKVALLSKFDVALRSLRICTEGRTNCGRCEKCVRTMINLAAVGALDRCTSFDVPLDLRTLGRIAIGDENTRAFVHENLRALENSERHRQLYEALDRVARRPLWRTTTIQLKRKLRRKITRPFVGLRKRWTRVLGRRWPGNSP